MPRQARKKSETGMYHVMARGINKQAIFQDNEDYLKFLEILGTVKAISEFEIFAYCLMSNHYHILLKTGKEDLGQIFKRMGARYVYWYNFKYQRTGHLYQDRYKSERIESDKYFITAMRYIHQNPIKAGIPEGINYKWSSYQEYLGKTQIIDSELMLNIMSKKEFIRYHQEINQDQFLEYEEKGARMTDEEAELIIRRMKKIKSKEEKSIQQMPKADRDELIKQIKEAGLSIRQISRLTGLTYARIRNI